MKLVDLKKTITINSIILAILVIIFISCVFFIFYQLKSSSEQTDKIKSETDIIKSKTQSMVGKASQAKKYKDLYSQIAKEKRTNFTGIKMDEINVKLKIIGDKYNITSREIKIAVPENLKDEPFKLKSFSVLLTTVTLTFRAYTDDRVFLFAREFMKSLNGFTILTNFDIRKEKDYTPENLINISSGSGTGNISAKVEFYWYSFKEEDKTRNNASRKSSVIKIEPVSN